MFRFKQFTIKQERAAMKVGTDGVLLGAWANVNNAHRILDIGTGTGLIALMMAQRTLANITALEIDEKGYLDACENVNNSRWADRINVINTALQEYNCSFKFDVIVSNPPFFIDSMKASCNSRTKARHTDTLSINDLFKYSAQLLDEDGEFHLILPVDNLEVANKAARSNNFYIHRICYVKPTPQINAKRVLLTYSFKNTSLLHDELIIEEFGRHNYSQKYIDLTKDFYMKM